MPVVRTDGRAGMRACGRTVTWLPKFFGCVDNQIFLPMVIRFARFAPESSATVLHRWRFYHLLLVPRWPKSPMTLCSTATADTEMSGKCLVISSCIGFLSLTVYIPLYLVSQHVLIGIKNPTLTLPSTPAQMMLKECSAIYRRPRHKPKDSNHRCWSL